MNVYNFCCYVGRGRTEEEGMLGSFCRHSSVSLSLLISKVLVAKINGEDIFSAKKGDAGPNYGYSFEITHEIGESSMYTSVYLLF
jgi:hypothetical protein